MKRMGLLNRLDRCARWALLLGLVLAFPPVARASISFNNRQAGFGAGTTLTVNNAYGAQGPTQDFPVPVGGMANGNADGNAFAADSLPNPPFGTASGAANAWTGKLTGSVSAESGGEPSLRKRSRRTRR